jgi:uncharacterized protein YegL
MLKNLVTPLLLLICLGAGGFYIRSEQNSRPLVQPVGTATPTAGLPAPRPGQNAPQPLPAAQLPDVDAMMVIDNSGSMFGETCKNHTPVPASDREQLRIRGADVIIGTLAADLKPRDTQLGIVTFGDDAKKVRPLTQLSNDTSGVRSELSAAIQNPDCQGDTNITAALRMAQAELVGPRARPGNQRVIVFLTDGAPTRGGNNPEIAKLIRELEQNQVLLFAVLLGNDPSLDAFRTFWQGQAKAHPNVIFYPISSSAEIPSLYKKITAELNKVPELANAPSLPPGQTVPIPVPANVQQVVFSVIKRAPGVPLTITTPQNTSARDLPPTQFKPLIEHALVEVFVIARPDAGTWTIAAPQGESITVLQPEYKSVYQVQLLQPDSLGLLAVDNSSDVLVQVIDIGSGQPISAELQLSVLVAPDGAPPPSGQSLPLKPGPFSPQYQVQLPAGTFSEGQQYQLTFNVEDKAGLRSQPSIYLLRAGRMPLLSTVMVTPTLAFTDQPIIVSASLANVDAATGAPVPRFVQPLLGGAVPSFLPKGPTTYETTIGPLGRPGTYALTVAYTGTRKDGQPFNSLKSITVAVQEPWSTVLLRQLAMTLALLTAAYLVFRFLLLGPLIPLFQRIGLSPSGYVRITPPGQKAPNGEESVRALLRRRRRLRRLSIGVGPGFDIALEPDPDTADSESAPPPRRSLWARLWGPQPKGYVRKKGRDTIIERGSSATIFGSQPKDIEIDQNLVEVSLVSLENPDPDA